MTDEIELALDNWGHLTPAEAVGQPLTRSVALEEIANLPIAGQIEGAVGSHVRIQSGGLVHHCRSVLAWRYEDADDTGFLVEILPTTGPMASNPKGIETGRRIEIKLYSIRLTDVPGRMWGRQTLWFSDRETYELVCAADDAVQDALTEMDRTLQHRWKKRE